MASPDLQMGGGGEGVIQALRKGWGGAVAPKNPFSALLALVWSKNKRGANSSAPSPGFATVVLKLKEGVAKHVG